MKVDRRIRGPTLPAILLSHWKRRRPSGSARSISLDKNRVVIWPVVNNMTDSYNVESLVIVCTSVIVIRRFIKRFMY